jgi:hypothetical protein
MKDEDSVAVSLIKNKIESLECTIKTYQGDENIGVRIQAQSKIVMLEGIIKDIEHTSKRLE